MNRIMVLLLAALLSACANLQSGSIADEPESGSGTTDVMTSADPAMTASAGQGAAPPAGQARRPAKIPPEILQKIGFDLNQFNDEGLLLSGGGTRAMTYEYCIPRARQAVSVISTIDFSAEVKTDAAGSKVGCSDQEVLAVGNSHQDNFKGIIVQLARLPFVKRIEQSSVE